MSDFAILNSIALYVFVYYYLLTSRRENREIGQLLRDVSSEINDMSYTVYASIASYMVFNLNKTDDNPIASLDPSKDSGKYTIGFIRRVARILFYMPFIAVVFTVICDIGSIFSPIHMLFSSPFRDRPMWKELHLSHILYITAMEAFACTVAVGIFKLNVRAVEYEKATRDVLDDFQDELKKANLIYASNKEG